MLTAIETNNSRTVKKLKIIFGTHGVAQYLLILLSLTLCYLTLEIYNIQKM